MNVFALPYYSNRCWLQLKEFFSRLARSLAAISRRQHIESNKPQCIVLHHDCLAKHCSSLGNKSARHIITLYVKGYDTRLIASSLRTNPMTIAKVVTIAIVNLQSLDKHSTKHSI